MKKHLITFSFIAIVSIGFSQSTVMQTKDRKVATEKKTTEKLLTVDAAKAKNDSQIDLKKGQEVKAIVLDEGTNSSNINGYEKKIVNGKEIYIKKSNTITVRYESK
ncbi:MAG: hypothetical protein COB15_05765 [Flavobacteriales bacterium]|nr:MAG: hypothetical protein COB15_05765 [Flavobacteriales bacterium]